jgi:glycosyltransferase involved in cell wall biosynthesis
MKILIINDFGYVNGGAAKVALHSAIGLTGRGHQVTFFCGDPGDNGPSLPDHIRVVTTNQIDSLANPNRREAIAQGIWNSKAADALSTLIADPEAFDLIHVHGWVKVLSPSILPVLQNTSIPAVVTCHDYFLACPNGGFYDYQEDAPCARRALSVACVTRHCDRRSALHKGWRVVRHGVQKHVAQFPRKLDAVITISGLNRQLLAPYFDPRTKVLHVDNPIDVTQKPAVPVAQSRRVMSLGQLTLPKDPKTLAHAAASANVPVTFIGDGPQAEVVRAANPDATITGWLPYDEAIATLRTARALVFPSRWAEASPLAVQEALALGIPVVVSDACAGREAITDGETGFLFPSGNADALARILTKLEDDDLVTKMGHQAYERYWADPFTLDKHVSQLEAAYATLKAGSNGPVS